ncbi:MAG TPA: hypothetical protein VNU95_05170 [Candidatus Acidoferrales bacterium]|jgi:hypothetical protein|nr:hypothetical protein [Candidatus Acidoferrales bacterium]
MKKYSDKTRARHLLEAREHGFRILPFFRHRARHYTFYAVLCAATLVFLAVARFWFAFALAVSFLMGVALFYFRWLFGQMHVWPFAMKVINWDVVKKISNDEPSV